MIAAITTWVAARLSGLWVKIAAFGGLVLAILLIGLRLIGIGREQERARLDRERIEAMKKRKEIDREVDDLAPTDVDQRLREWMRDSPKG